MSTFEWSSLACSDEGRLINHVSTIFQLIGALGVFLLGMKIMSEGLQAVAGSRLKELMGKITGNRFTGVLTGFGVTCVVQSSSATTVMVVSFVTAELLTLTQAIGVIMGANIGTTVTGWLVALLGFKVKITALALPAVGIGFGMTFLRRRKWRQWGEVLVGFGVLFLGLSLLKDSVPDISDPEQIAFVKSLTEHGFFSILAFVLIGTIATVVLQSSSATMTLTLTLAAVGWLPYEMAAAMVLGENIGTTATANIAAIGAPLAAQRAARAHFIFNIIGVIWALALMEFALLPVVDMLVAGNPDVDFAAIQSDEAAMAVAGGVVASHLAMFHTIFNVTNTAIMLPFVKQLRDLVVRWKPGDERDDRNKVTRFLSNRLVETPDLFLVQVGKELQHAVELVSEVFDQATYVVTHPKERLGSVVDETYDLYDAVAAIKNEVTYYTKIAARSANTEENAEQIAKVVHNAHRVERIGNHSAQLLRIAQKLHGDSSVNLSDEQLNAIEKLGQLVAEALENLGKVLAGEGDPDMAEELEDRIDDMRRKLRKDTIAGIHKDNEGVDVRIAFLDVVSNMEEIGDRAIGIIRRHLEAEEF